ncbi:MAG: MBL fold metallo-hydrolase [Nitrospirota bacterium]|nr:MBL fold metallo-hydrolase [Nitrospirota bacterium]
MATPLFHPALVNDPFGDPALYVPFQFERRALLFDLGDLSPLAPRHLLRISHVFVSHTHMDHFTGFDRLLRVRLGRGGALRLFGPPGFRDRVAAKLNAYTWNLVDNYGDFTILATEYHPDGRYQTARFLLRERFTREDGWDGETPRGMLVEEPLFTVRAVHLDHKVPCLAFALEEQRHVNVWKSRLDAMQLPTGPWLQQVKQAVLHDLPDATSFSVGGPNGPHPARRVTLGELRAGALSIGPGMKIAYVVDAGATADNITRIVQLAKGAHHLFCEAVFTEADADRARATFHLTARQCGEIARAAGVKRLTPFHHSTRYGHQGGILAQEAFTAFGTAAPAEENPHRGRAAQ